MQFLDDAETSLLISKAGPVCNNKKTARMFHRHALRPLATLLCLGLLVACASAPPVQEMSDARQAIMVAEAADADHYAAATLADARRYLADAEQLLREEAYGPARMNAVRAKNRANRALAQAQSAAESETD